MAQPISHLLPVLWIATGIAASACLPPADRPAHQNSPSDESGDLVPVTPSGTTATGTPSGCDPYSIFASCTRLEMAGPSVSRRRIHDECGRAIVEESLSLADGTPFRTATWTYHPDGRLDSKEVDGLSTLAPQDGIPDEVWTWAYDADGRLARSEETFTGWGTCFRDYIHDDDDPWWDQVVAVCPFGQFSEILEHNDAAPEALQWAVRDYDDGSNGIVDLQRRASWDPTRESGALEEEWLDVYPAQAPIRTTYQYEGPLLQFTEMDVGLDGVLEGRTDFSYDSDGRPTGSVYQSLLGNAVLVEVFEWECPG